MHGTECKKCNKGTMSLVSYSRGEPDKDDGTKPRLEYECAKCEAKTYKSSHVS